MEQAVVTSVLAKEPMLSDNRRPLLLQLVQKLQAKLTEDASQPEFKLMKVVRKAHVPVSYTHLTLPTNREV